MKINWGTSIVIAFILFAAMLTYYMVRGANNPSHLVTEDYYEQEIRYQERINQKKNAAALQPLRIEKLAQELHIKFPAEFADKSISGTILFYRPNNQNLDFELAINAQNNSQIIPLDKFVSGNWIVKISASSANKNFFWERKVRI